MTSVAKVSSAHRMRLHRIRRQRGLRCLTLEIRDTEIAALVRKGLLLRKSASEPKAVRDALYLVLERSLGGAS